LQAEVTERKGAEAEAEARAKELATSEEKYRRLLGDINDGYLVVQDEKVIMANERAAEIYGVPLDEYIGSPLGASFPADVQEQIRERFRRRIAGEAEPERYELTTATGIAVEVNAKLIDYEGRPAVAAVVRDITHRKRTEEALRERTRATSYI
jgi:PAS domain S-box-containing protein